jgi:hypothetical protein
LAIPAVVLFLSAAIAIGAQAAKHDRSLAHPRAATSRGVTFGIYPGGAAGTVGALDRSVPEDPAKRLAALQELRPPGRPFVLHIYASYTGRGSATAAEQVGRDIALYTASGFGIELVVAYRPVGGTRTTNVAGFVAFVRDTIANLGSNRRFVALQVTNEANVHGAPNAADGAYRGVEDALVRGVIAAKSQVRRQGLRHLKIGFNWAYSRDSREPAFWRRLGRLGGPVFRRSVDWVGLDLYPGTWGPRMRGGLAVATRKTVLASLGRLRRKLMPLAGLSSHVPLHISENGYPTGPRRTEAMQVTAMKAVVTTVNANRSIYRVTDYRWFDLRDADSSSETFEGQYGLMHDDYTPKAGFGAYRKLVAALSR